MIISFVVVRMCKCICVLERERERERRVEVRDKEPVCGHIPVADLAHLSIIFNRKPVD